eukprot:CAMPEP_0180145602 /NCGR_PEP_ID=MMETSP0986-20121125/17814_1 /TAXON_ID=697907 /ORGANISM="non described non described, Strain CCMP2293" /LENGTH=166 /DNA_ID=CAMNT_0022090103 /DNA_START=110 /DNA_END=610 /DNA_ORIENTATION=+
MPELPDIFGQKIDTDDGAIYIGADAVPLGGVGLVLAPSVAQRAFVVLSMVRNGPAHLSGLVKKGDALVSIDGTLVAGDSFQGALPALCGAAGSTVVLELLGSHQGQRSTPVEVALVREANMFPDELALAAPGFDTVLNASQNYQPGLTGSSDTSRGYAAPLVATQC